MKGRTGKSTHEPKKTIAKSVIKAARPRLHGGHFGGDKPSPRADKKARGGSAKWIQKADLKKGAFTAQADKAGESVHEYAEKKKDAPGKTGKRARLALTFQKMAHKK